MDERQIAFIICTNNAQYYDECVRYIQDLYVPEGYDTDIICIQEAESMAQGYNAGMQASSARYKVYLHQDTFLLNRNFLYDILRIFKQDDNIGMIGVLGARDLPKNADCYTAWDTGTVYAYNGRRLHHVELYQEKESGYVSVKAVDGLIMITQKDLPWREDLLDGWDFYDVSQSLEMKRYGYKVVIPYQAIPWCYHDCGASKLGKYHFYRHKMIQAYPQYFVEDGTDTDSLEEQNEEKIKYRLQNDMIGMIGAGAYDQLAKLADYVREVLPKDTCIYEIVNMMEIYSLEKARADGRFSEWWLLKDWERIYEYYRWVRFVLLRIGYRKEDERAEEIRKLVKEERITKDAIRKISISSLGDTENIYPYLLRTNREEPLVSVLIPVYSKEKSVNETLASVLAQTYQNMEIIVLSNTGTDHCREEIGSLHDSRIKTLLYEENHTICSMCNVGFRAARGKYVALIGQNDLWMSDKLEKQVDFLETHLSYSVCFTWADIIDEDKNIINKKWIDRYRGFCSDNRTTDQWLKHLFLHNNVFCTSSACMRKAFLDQTGYYRYALSQLQDHDLWMRLFGIGPAFILQEKLTCYCCHGGEDERLSAINKQMIRRTICEKQCVQEMWLDGLSADRLREIFGNDLKQPDVYKEEEVLCEKAFLLWKAGNCFAFQRFIQLLDNEECRRILLENYHFSLQDYYEMNGGGWDECYIDRIGH